MKAFLKLSPDKDLLDKMLEAIKLFIQTDSWNRGNGQYIPFPTTWLKSKRWEDEGITVHHTAMSDENGGCPY